MKNKRFFAFNQLKVLPVGFQFIEKIGKRNPDEFQVMVKPYVAMQFYSSESCRVFPLNKPISKIIRTSKHEEI